MGAEAEAKPGLEVDPAVPEWRSRGVLYDRERAAQRTPHKLRRRSIAAPGRASRLGVVSFMRLLARSRHLLRGIGCWRGQGG